MHFLRASQVIQLQTNLPYHIPTIPFSPSNIWMNKTGERINKGNAVRRHVWDYMSNTGIFSMSLDLTNDLSGWFGLSVVVVVGIRGNG